MGKTFDALYGSVREDALSKAAVPSIPKGNDIQRIAAVLKSRAEGYFNRAKQFEDAGENADREAAMGTCEELAYVAKMLEGGSLEALEAAGKRT
jgi:hypothetical protein